MDWNKLLFRFYINGPSIYHFISLRLFTIMQNEKFSKNSFAVLKELITFDKLKSKIKQL